MTDESATLADEIKSLGKEIKDLDKAVAEATEQRKEEHEEFITFQTQNSAALQLIEKAKNKLSFSDACFSSSAARRAALCLFMNSIKTYGNMFVEVLII